VPSHGRTRLSILLLSCAHMRGMSWPTWSNPPPPRRPSRAREAGGKGEDTLLSGPPRGRRSRYAVGAHGLLGRLRVILGSLPSPSAYAGAARVRPAPEGMQRTIGFRALRGMQPEPSPPVVGYDHSFAFLRAELADSTNWSVGREWPKFLVVAAQVVLPPWKVPICRLHCRKPPNASSRAMGLGPRAAGPARALSTRPYPGAWPRHRSP
jgi:hypothetical protein